MIVIYSCQSFEYLHVTFNDTSFKRITVNTISKAQQAMLLDSAFSRVSSVKVDLFETNSPNASRLTASKISTVCADAFNRPVTQDWSLMATREGWQETSEEEPHFRSYRQRMSPSAIPPASR
jgi:hypothetical protein